MLGALALAATLTVQDYATMPYLSTPQWSPDGTQIAYVVTKADLDRSVYDADVWLIGADGKNDRRLTYSDASDTSPRWSPDGSRLAFLSERDGSAAIYLIDPRGGESQRLTSEPTTIRAFEWSPDGKSIAFTRVDEKSAEEQKRAMERDDAHVEGEGKRASRLYLIDVATREIRRLTEEGSVFSFSWSPDGKTIVFDRGPGTTLDDLYRTDIYSVSVADAKVQPLVVRPGFDREPHFSPDGKSIAFTSSGGRPGWTYEHDVHVVAASDGTPRNIGNAYDRTPEQIEWSDDSQAIWIEGPWNTTTQLFRLAADGSSLKDVTHVQGVVADVDVRGDRAAFICQSLTAPPELCVMNSLSTGAQPLRLTHHNAAFEQRELGETRVIRWKNPKDGLEIEGLLTLPVGYTKGRVPLLTFVHGGPASRFDQGFLGYLGSLYAPQALAAKGFAVLRPNPRGTGGYGESFRQANVNDWGGMDWIDINAGIDKVIADGIADPERLGMMGWSYGGYMSSWAVGHSDRFKAISIGAPVVDLLSFHGTTDIRDFIPAYFPSMDLELLRAHSPAWHLKKPAIPILIQQGEADDRVPPSQSTLLYRLLDELGANVTLVLYPRTPHVPREPKLRIDVATRNVEFFMKNVK